METSDKETAAIAIQRYREELEDNIRQALREYEMEHEGPVEIDLSFFEGEGGAEVDEKLKMRIQNMVDAFQRKPAVQRSQVRVHKVTAMDSDADGQVAVRVHYDYAAED